MKKGNVILWSIIIYVVVCSLELLVCNSSIIPHFGMDDYTIVEKVLFYVIAILSGTSVAFLLRAESIKCLLINSIIMWCVFIIIGQVIGLRNWIGIFTNNETIVLGVNFVGEDIWIAHYMGCFVGMVLDVIILMFRNGISRQNMQK